MKFYVPQEKDAYNATLSGGDRVEPHHIFIAVMGMTGVGKSSFIKVCTGSDVVVGHGIESCTTTLTGYCFQRGHFIMNLIDTPGFNDTIRSDSDILKEISIWLNLTYRANVRLTGIIYLHRVSDNRMGGSAMTNLNMLKKLCGDECLPNVILATTMWSDPALTARYNGTHSSALSIISQFEGRPPIVLDIQRQMVDEGRMLLQTTAGRFVDEGLLAKKTGLLHELEAARQEAMSAQREKDDAFAQDIEKPKMEIRRKLFQAEMQRRSLNADLQSRLKERDEQMQRLVQQAGGPGFQAIAIDVAKGLGNLGPAILAMVGEVFPGTAPIVAALMVGVKALRFIFEAVKGIM